MIQQSMYGFGAGYAIGGQYDNSYWGGGYNTDNGFGAQFAALFGTSYNNNGSFGPGFGYGYGVQGCLGSIQPPQFGNSCHNYLNCAPSYGGQGFGCFPPNMGYGGCGPSYGCGGSYGGGYGGIGVAGNVQFGQLEIPGQQNKMWDVWFDSKDGQKTVQRSPIVLDLNGNGKADITGKNILGDGKIDGPTTMFDLDPNNISYEAKSQQRRPGSGAPAVQGGYWVDANGKKTDKSPPKGTQKNYAGWKYLDAKGQTVGEMKSDGLYHYGKQEKREQTEWLSKNGGDAFLVSDYNKDGQINDATELFGTEGPNGKKYKNGYEKLAALHDTNKDGKISGKELENLKVWKDSNADGKVQEGELQSLAQHGITSFDVKNYNASTMEGSYGSNEKTVPYMAYNVVGAGFGGGYGGGFGGYGGGFGGPGGGFGGGFGYGGGFVGGASGVVFGTPYDGVGFGGSSPYFGGQVPSFGFSAPWMGGYG